VGIGTLITNQLAAVLIASVAYLIGTQVVGLAFYLLSELFDNPAIMEWQVILPSIASQVMISGADIPGLPSWWVGALVLFGYALITGVAGTLIVRRRDIA
jgi:ABC-2 type transport system permease protein